MIAYAKGNGVTQVDANTHYEANTQCDNNAHAHFDANDHFGANTEINDKTHFLVSLILILMPQLDTNAHFDT